MNARGKTEDKKYKIWRDISHKTEQEEQEHDTTTGRNEKLNQKKQRTKESWSKRGVYQSNVCCNKGMLQNNYSQDGFWKGWEEKHKKQIAI